MGTSETHPLPRPSVSKIDHLPSSPSVLRTPSDRDAAGREIAARALKATHPRMSLAATRREVIRSGISKKVIDQMIAGARDIVDAELANANSRERASTWITPSRAAGLLGTTVAWVQEKLETPEGRRLLGFPWYDGRRWRIPLPACHPDSRAAFLAALPANEPLANLVLFHEEDQSQ